MYRWIFIGINWSKYFLWELLVLLRESRARCKVCERVGTVCNPDPELFASLVRSRPRFELCGIGIWHRPVFLGEKPPEVLWFLSNVPFITLPLRVRGVEVASGRGSEYCSSCLLWFGLACLRFQWFFPRSPICCSSWGRCSTGSRTNLYRSYLALLLKFRKLWRSCVWGAR